MRKKNEQLLVSLAAFLAFAAIATLRKLGLLESMDASVYEWASSHTTDGMTGVMRFISAAGQWFVYVPMAILLMVLPVSRTKVGIPASIVLSLSAVANHVLKFCFAIDRPDMRRLIVETGYGFPSGHAMNGTAFLGICTLLFWRHSTKRPLKTGVFVTCVLFLLLTGFGRVYLGVHAFSDVLAGYAGGVCLSALALGVTHPRDETPPCP